MVNKYLQLYFVLLLRTFFSEQPLRADDDLLCQETSSVNCASKYQQKSSQSYSWLNIIVSGAMIRHCVQTVLEALTNLTGLFHAQGSHVRYLSVTKKHDSFDSLLGL